MDLSELKRDKDLLLAVLGCKGTGQHRKCPWHDDRHGSLAVWVGEDGVWLWKCHAGCGSGTVIDAAMRVYGVATPFEAVRAIERELGVRVGRDEDYVEPRIDHERAERFVKTAHDNLLGDFDLQEEYLVEKRGLTDLTVVHLFRLGFIVRARFREWHSWQITGWVLPVTDERNRLLAVKIHTEGRRDRKMPKCLWAPFGTYPAGKPKHGTATLWPPPEMWMHPGNAGPEMLFLCPGELKALSFINAGLPATSVTMGESGKLPRRLIDRLERVKARTIFLPCDTDPAGQIWGRTTSEHLSKAGLAAVASPAKELMRGLSEKPTHRAEARQSDFLDTLDSEWGGMLKAARARSGSSR